MQIVDIRRHTLPRGVLALDLGSRRRAGAKQVVRLALVDAPGREPDAQPTAVRTPVRLEKGVADGTLEQARLLPLPRLAAFEAEGFA
jgi:hypothetical protein